MLNPFSIVREAPAIVAIADADIQCWCADALYEDLSTVASVLSVVKRPVQCCMLRPGANCADTELPKYADA